MDRGSRDGSDNAKHLIRPNLSALTYAPLHSDLDISLEKFFRPLGTGSWKIVWYGDIGKATRTGEVIPTIRLQMKRVSTAGKPHSEDPSYRSVSVPAAFLRLCRLGDIWTDGKFSHSDPDSVEMVFESLKIDESCCQVVPIGKPIESEDGESHYPLSFDHYDAHKLDTGSFCAQVGLSGNTLMLVPCLELIRFYFGSSGSLLKRLFDCSIQGRKLYTNASLNKKTRIGNLHLESGIPGVAAATIGRIAFDKYAAKAVRWIVNSGMASASVGKPFYPRTTFPFSGETDLTARGRWIDTSDQQVFLVEQLIQCTHPFPYEKLFYTSQLNVINLAKKRQISADPKTANSYHSIPIVLDSGEIKPGSELVGAKVESEGLEPFPDLVGKDVRRYLPTNSFKRKGASTDEDETTLLDGETSSSSTSKAAEVTTEDRIDPDEETFPNDLEIFNYVFGHFQERDLLKQVRVFDDQELEWPEFKRADEVFTWYEAGAECIWMTRIVQTINESCRSIIVLAKELFDIFDGDRYLIVEAYDYDPFSDPDKRHLSVLLDEFGKLGPEELRYSIDKQKLDILDDRLGSISIFIPLMVMVYLTRDKGDKGELIDRWKKSEI